MKIDLETGCWLWTGNYIKDGYGHLKVDGRNRSAHTLSYEAFVGPVPDGLELDHTCKRRLCFSPLHLEPVTHRVNVLRGGGPAAVNARKTHCDAGHDYSDPDVLGRNGNQRYCKVCNRERRMESLARLSSRTECTNGHDLTDPANQGTSNGHMVCRVCVRDRNRAYRERKRAGAPAS